MRDRRRISRPCDDCGIETFRAKRPDRPNLCTECAQNRAIVGAREMHAKSGPAWDRWLASNATKGPEGRTDDRT